MGFRENLQKKIKIRQLTATVTRSINPADSSQRIDRDAMRQLLDAGGYPHQKERDLDLYAIDEHQYLVLDNELKIYNTTAEDIGLRKSPTVKEMISIRNAIKILNDKDVVISRKTESVKLVKKRLIDGLDLSYGKADIESLTQDGISALKHHDTEGVADILMLFAELLEFGKAPRPFRADRYHIWGMSTRQESGRLLFGPVIIYDPTHNTLKMLRSEIDSKDKEGLRRFQGIVKGETDADLSGDDVLEALQQRVLARDDAPKK